MSEAPARIFQISSVISLWRKLNFGHMTSMAPDLWEMVPVQSASRTRVGSWFTRLIPDKYPISNPNPLLKIKNSTLQIWGFRAIHVPGEEFSGVYSSSEQKNNDCRCSTTDASLMNLSLGTLCQETVVKSGGSWSNCGRSHFRRNVIHLSGVGPGPYIRSFLFL